MLGQRDHFVIGLYQMGKVFHICHSNGFGSVLPGRRNRSFPFPHHSQGSPWRRPLVAKLTVAGRWTVSHLLSTLETKGLPKRCSSARLLEWMADVSSMRFVSDALWQFCEDNRTGGGPKATIRTSPYHIRGLTGVFLLSHPSLPPFPPQVSRIHSIQILVWHSNHFTLGCNPFPRSKWKLA